MNSTIVYTAGWLDGNYYDPTTFFGHPLAYVVCLSLHGKQEKCYLFLEVGSLASRSLPAVPSQCLPLVILLSSNSPVNGTLTTSSTPKKTQDSDTILVDFSCS
ncbi:unnamed protein product [Cylicocyclus nassatus]|uniref:Uncharacterized protein n=1 Tax=Cylicocyclus nassatus TaxID=53992 RepID=A0AA36MDF4_CYLNA|nr:unnamed protein product [Cylicocyclus nassatus]